MPAQSVAAAEPLRTRKCDAVPEMVVLLAFAFVAGAATAFVALRAAGAPRAAVGRRHGRGAAAARDRHRARALVHVRDRRARLCDRRAGASGRPPARRRDRGARRVRNRAGGPPALGTRGSRALPARPDRTGLARRRWILVRPALGRQPRPGLRAVRGADPGRRDHRVRVAAVLRRAAGRGSGVRDRSGGRPLRADARRTARHIAAVAAQRACPARDRRGDGLRRRGDGVPARHPVRDGDRERSARGAREPRARSWSRATPRASGSPVWAAWRGRRRGAGAPPRACRCSRRRPRSAAHSSWFNTPGGRPLSLSSHAAGWC